MAEKCFGCISLKTFDDVCTPDRGYHANKSSSPISRRPTTGKSSILRIIHVGGDEDIFTEPKSASEFLNQYPGHCLTYPDIFVRPWAVVSPKKRLFPGESYCLVRSSIVQKLQLDLLQSLGGKPPVDHNDGATTSDQETNTCSLPRSLCMNKIENVFVPPLKERISAADSRAWSPELEPVQEIRTPVQEIRTLADHIR